MATGAPVYNPALPAAGAPDATYITQTASSDLSAEQALSSLSTGLLKVTTGTGALSTAVAGTDYVSSGSLSSLSTGLMKVTTGTGAITTAAAPTDYIATTDARLGVASNIGGIVMARGKLTVGSAVQSLSIPVADAEGNGRIIAAGRIVGDTDSASTLRDLTPRINTATTNVGFVTQQIYSGGPTIYTSSRIAQFSSDGSIDFQLQMDTAKSSSPALKRTLRFWGAQLRASSAPFIFWWHAAIYYNDSSTTITSIDLYGNVAASIVPGSYIVYEELKLP